jgi:16S rRNA processing protein RimM
MAAVAIGKIRTSVGVRGFFKVLSFSGEVEHFKRLKEHQVELRYNEKIRFIKIEDVCMSGAVLTLKAEGIDSPEEAKKLSGWELYVDREKASPLGENEYYQADLCGCSLVLNGNTVGKITAVRENAVSELLEVEVDGKTRLIPFMERYVGDIDLELQTIELKEDWLLE